LVRAADGSPPELGVPVADGEDVEVDYGRRRRNMRSILVISIPSLS
jgi:hypothetical protein